MFYWLEGALNAPQIIQIEGRKIRHSVSRDGQKYSNNAADMSWASHLKQLQIKLRSVINKEIIAN
jgi:hypothetical protein